MAKAIQAHISPVARVLAALIRGYQVTISKVMPSRCRFYPSCSQYALEAVHRYGALRGGWLGIKRVARCHPFHPGGIDPVPAPSDLTDS